MVLLLDIAQGKSGHLYFRGEQATESSTSRKAERIETLYLLQRCCCLLGICKSCLSIWYLRLARIIWAIAKELPLSIFISPVLVNGMECQTMLLGEK